MIFHILVWQVEASKVDYD